ncbi:hypothetical protein ERO13_A02G112401v2 [Gossypium hirsutum]|uniref:Uncharacterized protein n=1 Tax=Gossypium tomentosum TaxID=34277 RepID=A0A5D2RIK9_GOSTO|nr:hypothetical protein ERO13_A02G112401v2 [Gossypium hirsutum]TYI39988.1 hypothetical protein ES332_A02G133100v1 [Gossypium tomentosum]
MSLLSGCGCFQNYRFLELHMSYNAQQNILHCSLVPLAKNQISHSSVFCTR